MFPLLGPINNLQSSGKYLRSQHNFKFLLRILLYSYHCFNKVLPNNELYTAL